MKLFTFTVLALVVLINGDDKVQEKRGAVDYTPSTASSVYSTAAPVTYNKIQQPGIAQKAVAYAAPQPQYYSQPTFKYAAAPAVAYTAPVQQQYEPQAVAYAQPAVAKVAAAAAPAAIGKIAYSPQYSLAGDVSSFSYSSPVVTYNNLGLLSQIAGKAAGAAVAYSPAQAVQTVQPQYQAAAPVAKVQYAPGPIAYQGPAVQKVAPVAYQLPVQRVAYASVPQAAGIAQKVIAAPQPQAYYTQQQAYVSPQAYTGPQVYSVPQAHLTPQAAPQPQSYAVPVQAAHSVPQPIYSSVPQYVQQAPQQVKYATPGVTYAH